MKFYTKLLAIALPALLPFSAHGATDFIPIDRTIDQVLIYEEVVLIKFSPSYTNTQGCSKSEKDTAILRNTDGDNNQLLSGILSAAAAGNTVGIALNGCGGGSYDYPKLYRIAVDY